MRAIVALCLALSVPARAAGQEPAPSAPAVQLEVVEGLSESLANDLLGLSVAARDRHRPTIAPYFAPRIDGARFPRVSLPEAPAHRWFTRHGWETAAAAQGDGRAVVDSLLELLGHFSEIDDVRFKVRDATFDPGSAVVGGAKVPTARP
jgi:hypothetical protein